MNAGACTTTAGVQDGDPWHFRLPAESSHNSSFSHLGVPAPAGMSDWYENGQAK